MKALIALFFVLVGVVYAGIGWFIAWIIDLAFDANVNYTAAVVGGLIIYTICVIPVLLVGMGIKKAEEELKEIER